MSSAFVAALRAEVANLEAELTKSLTYQRLLEARKMLALYEPTAPKNDGGEIEGTLGEPVPAIRPGLRIVRKPSPERVKALNAARMFLANRVGPTPTSDIYDHIASLGIEIGGTDPRNNLSAMLSNSAAFKSHGRSGWTLSGNQLAGGDPKVPPPPLELAPLPNPPPKPNQE